MNKTKSPLLPTFKNLWPERAGLSLAMCVLALGWSPLPTKAVVVMTNLFSFSETNGSLPAGKLLQTPDGSFYGTTSFGGTNGGFGTIFKWSGGTFTSLFSFNNTNGDQPNSGMILASDGNFYGTTHLGGTYCATTPYNIGYGSAFRFGTNGAFTSLASFNGTNGYQPNQLVQAADGNFYGVAEEGGTNMINSELTAGTVFKMDTNGNLTCLLDFNGTNGANPVTGLTLYTNGTLFGVTILANLGGAEQTGTAFQVTTNGALNVLDYFSPNTGNQPTDLILANDGNFYGTCAYGGAYGFGTVFQLKPDGTFTNLVSFNGTNGAAPQQLIQAHDGYLYGVANGGGAYNNGGIFQCTTAGALTNLYSFTGGVDGGSPASIMQAKDSSFYGVATYGGASGEGAIFKLTVAPNPDILSFTVSNQVATINFAAANGLTYVLQHKATLNLNDWTNLATITATGPVGVATDNLGTNNLGFYRVALPQ